VFTREVTSHTRRVTSHTRGVTAHTRGVTAHTRGVTAHTRGVTAHTRRVSSQTPSMHVTHANESCHTCLCLRLLFGKKVRCCTAHSAGDIEKWIFFCIQKKKQKKNPLSKGTAREKSECKSITKLLYSKSQTQNYTDVQY